MILKIPSTETTRIQIVVSDMEARLGTRDLNPGGCSSEKAMVIGGSTILRICKIEIFLILQLMTISRFFDFVLSLCCKCN